MTVFDRFRRKTEIDTAGIEAIRARVRSMREQIGRRDVELSDLFQLISEDDPKVFKNLSMTRSELTRVWPHEIPSPRPNTAPPESKITYSNWDANRPPGKFIAP